MMDEKEIHLKDYLRIVGKRKYTITTFFIITLTVVIIATFTATPQFRAYTTVMVEKNTASPLTGRSVYTPYDPEFLETQYQVIKSASVARKVVDTLDVERVYSVLFPEETSDDSIITNTVGWLKQQYGAFKKMIGIGEIQSFAINDPALDAGEPMTKAEVLEQFIKNQIQVEPVPDSRVIIISFMCDNPSVSMKITNSIAQAYIEELLDMRMEISGYSIKWMTKKAETERKKLEESEKLLYRYQKENNIITIEDRIAVIPERMSELSRHLTAAETEKKELEEVYSQIKRMKTEALETIPAIAENLSIDVLKKQIIATEQKISELSKKYGRKHPVMLSANDELVGYKQKKAAEIQKAIRTIKNRYELAKSNESNLRNLLNATKFEAANLNEKYIQMNILKRDVETNRYLYDALVKKMKEKNITEENQTINVWVIDKAVLPEIPASPKKKRNILLAAILGIFGGIGLAFFLEYMDNTVKSPEDIEDRFNVPVIGTIGLFKGKHETIVEAVSKDVNSQISENFKSLRTSVFLSSADTPPKTLLVTSVSPGEGKSTISACLAVTVAKTGKRTLLIDGDMRRPVQHKNFDLANTSGLSSFLAGLTSDEAINKGIIENLDVIGAGPVPPNPSELLSSPRMEPLLLNFSDHYDMIIIDSPPVISVSDPLIISKHVDGVIVVTYAGSTTYEMLQKGLKLFNENSVPITGTVVNRFDAKKSGYYYGYGDYYYSSSKTDS